VAAAVQVSAGAAAGQAPVPALSPTLRARLHSEEVWGSSSQPAQRSDSRAAQQQQQQQGAAAQEQDVLGLGLPASPFGGGAGGSTELSSPSVVHGDARSEASAEVPSTSRSGVQGALGPLLFLLRSSSKRKELVQEQQQQQQAGSSQGGADFAEAVVAARSASFNRPSSTNHNPLYSRANSCVNPTSSSGGPATSKALAANAASMATAIATAAAGGSGSSSPAPGGSVGTGGGSGGASERRRRPVRRNTSLLNVVSTVMSTRPNSVTNKHGSPVNHPPAPLLGPLLVGGQVVTARAASITAGSSGSGLGSGAGPSHPALSRAGSTRHPDLAAGLMRAASMRRPVLSTNGPALQQWPGPPTSQQALLLSSGCRDLISGEHASGSSGSGIDGQSRASAASLAIATAAQQPRPA
jgi:hypothetical protein